MNNTPKFTDLGEVDKRNLLNLIAQQDIRQLRSLSIHTYNLNFLIEDNDIQFDQKISPLLSACYIGKIDIIIMLLDNENIDVDLESFPEKYTPLMVACFKGFYEIVRLLLERKANVNKMNRLGQKPILFCFSRLEENNFRYENKKICMMLLDLLLAKGADINIRIDEKEGYTVLMKLASTEILTKEKLNNTIDIIQFLIERGADPTIRGYNNKSVYDVICENNDNSYKEELIYVLKNSKQIVFYNDSSIVSDAHSFKSGNKKVGASNDACIIVESTETRMNCCNICKIIC